jgi:uncharacterized protein YbaR (Trm112 family)
MNSAEHEISPVNVQDASLMSFAPLQRIVCCPFSKKPLILMTLQGLLSHLPENEVKRIPTGTVGAFVSRNQMLAYPIIDYIVDFLQEDALKLSEVSDLHSNSIDSEASAAKQNVKQWYDYYGWKRNHNGIYNDVAFFSQIDDTGYKHYEILSHLSLTPRFLSGGEFLLDAASGAIALPEYLTYSWYYKYRVCVDFSLTALQEARTQLQDKGFYCLADICHLPFVSEVFDGIISGYTVQHVPETEQRKAVEELYRVLKQKRSLCITASVKATKLRRIIFKLLMFQRRILGKLVPAIGPPVITESCGRPEAPHTLYAYLQDLKWWLKVVSSLNASSSSIECHRLMSKGEFEFLFGTSKRKIKLVRGIENFFSVLITRISDHILIEVQK